MAGLIIGILAGASGASGQWTTYHGDSARSGVDSSSTGSVPFAAAWKSPNLTGDVWGQPVISDGLVIVATEHNDVYALSEATGQVVWHRMLGTAVDASQLPCGDISPSVGVTSTPVIDTATGRVFVVADTWDGSKASSIQHRLYGFDVATGNQVSGLPLSVDPPKTDHTALLQRTALALDNGHVIIGYGGNDGDCGTYNGWLVSAPETGGALTTFAVSTGSGGGAIWGSGDGAVVDGAGNLWVSTGNGFGSPYDYQESVLKLSSGLGLLDHWAPSDWQYLDNNDIDLGSSEPLLLPDGLVFQIGKEGRGYLLSSAKLGGTGGAPVYERQVCGGSYGGNIYYNGVIYVTCQDGLYALSLNTTTRRFAPLSSWQVPSGANGPPIVSGNLVWATGWDSGTLYGLNLGTGNAVVTRSTPDMEHFATPSASDGKLFLATGNTVEAYNVAKAISQPGSPPTSTCGRIRLKLIRPRHGRITRVRVYLNHERLANRRAHRLKYVSFMSPAKRSFTVRVVESTSTHHKLTFKASYKSCHRVRHHHKRKH